MYSLRVQNSLPHHHPIQQFTTDSWCRGIRAGKYGDYIFYKTTKMKKPNFYDIKPFAPETSEDYKICDIVILKSWIQDKYKI